MVFVVIYSIALPFPLLFSPRVAPVDVLASRSGWAQVPCGFIVIAVSVVLVYLKVRDLHCARGLCCGALRLGCVVLGPSRVRVVLSARRLRCGALRLSCVALRLSCVALRHSGV